MVPAVMVLGLVAEAGAWWLVATRRRDVWTTLIPVAGVMGVAAVFLGPPELSPDVSPGVAAVAGATAGVALYAATRAFVVVVRRWDAFRRDSIRTYLRQGTVPLALALLLSAGVGAAGEELFWRGLFQVHAARGLDSPAAGAALTWGAFVLANLPSLNLAIVAGAVVGGAVWTALALWTGGILASLLCHGVWTALMLWLPVVRPAAGEVAR